MDDEQVEELVSDMYNGKISPVSMYRELESYGFDGDLVDFL